MEQILRVVYSLRILEDALEIRSRGGQSSVPCLEREMKKFLSFVLIACSCALIPAKTTADESFSDEEKQERRLELPSWLKLYGFVNVGYGVSEDHQHRGVPKSGTLDLHTIALQARISPNRRNEFVLQLANEKVGVSPSNELRSDLEVDWLYYHHRLSNGETSIRLGRVPLPVGIYNEIKDVGVLLPFYRPSGVLYGDGTWTSDSVDGLVLSHRFVTPKWSFDADLYYGEWDRIETDGVGGIDVADIKNALGFWLWINTPVDGLRFGLGGNRFDASGGVFLAPGVTDREETVYYSLDADFDRFRLRAEYSKREFTGGNWNPFYVELDVGITERLRASALYDTGELLFEIPFFATFDGKVEEIYGLGARFYVKPNLVVKLERQWFEGYGQIEDVDLSIFFDEPVKANLWILSASLSF